MRDASENKASNGHRSTKYVWNSTTILVNGSSCQNTPNATLYHTQFGVPRATDQPQQYNNKTISLLYMGSAKEWPRAVSSYIHTYSSTINIFCCEGIFFTKTSFTSNLFFIQGSVD